MLTEGAVLDDFEKNPLLLFNHIRPEGNNKNQILPMGHWEDLKIEGDEITGVPVFDDDDEFAMSIYKKVENGTIRMCSAGAEPLETSEKREHLVPGQTKATVTKWRLKEASICDIGSNPGSLAVQLYDHFDKAIALSEESLQKIIPNIEMKDPKIKLSEEEEKQAKLAAEEAKAKLSDEDKDKLIAKLKLKLQEMEEKLRLAEEEKETERVENLVSKAISMRKITASQKQHFIKLAKGDFKTTEELIASLPSSPTVKENLENQPANTESERIEKLAEKSWDELFHSGELQFVKLNAPDIYKSKYLTKFGKEPKNV
jgi:hypothetical protein